MKKNVVIAGEMGYFIPKEEFESGVFLNEESLKRFREKLIENDKLITRGRTMNEPQKTAKVNVKVMIFMSFVLFAILALIGFATRHYPANGGWL